MTGWLGWAVTGRAACAVRRVLRSAWWALAAYAVLRVSVLGPTILTAQTRPGTRAPSAPASRVSLALIDVPVTDALETLAVTAGIGLVWQSSALGAPAERRISCRVENAEPEAVLRCITKAAGLDFVRLSSGTYVVIAGSEVAPRLGSLAGVVLDASSGSPVSMARVELAERSNALLSSDDGGFVFRDLLPGRYALHVRALGYTPMRLEVELAPGQGRVTRLMLAPQAQLVRPIVVNGLRAGALGMSSPNAATGTTSFEGTLARAVVAPPSLFLPGAPLPLGVSRRDGTGDLHMQGGDLGEHPWRLDGIPLYDVTSLSGLLGMVAPLAVEQLTLRRSGYRADVGSFAAGVLDLQHLVDATPRGPQAEMHADPLAASARLSAPVSLGAANGSVMLAGRTGLWNWTAPPALTRAMRHWSTPEPVLLSRLAGVGALPGMENLESSTFAAAIGREDVTLHDLHAALRLQSGVAHTIDASAFRLERGVRFDGTVASDRGTALRTEDRYAWRTTGAQLTHKWLLGTRVRQQLQLRTAQHALDHDGSMRMTSAPSVGLGAHEDNRIAETTLAAQWRVPFGTRTDVSLGLEGTRTRATLNLANRVLRPLAVDETVWRGTALADATVQLADRRYLDVGLRVTQLQSGRTYGEPRVALRGEHGVDRVFTWRLAAGGYHQFVNQYDVASTMPTAFVPGMRFWLPGDGRTPVAQAWHGSSEMAWRVASGWELRAETFARWHPVLPMFDYGVMFDPTRVNTAIADSLAFAVGTSGRATGLGVRLQRDVTQGAWRTRSELAYDLGWATRTFPSRFANTAQPVPWLEPHRALWSTDVQRGGVTLATRFRGVWGRRWALRQAYYDLLGASSASADLPIVSPGQMRRPALLDLDVGATWERELAGTRVEFGASVLNAMARRNVLDYGLQRVASDDGNAADGNVADGTPARYRMQPRFLPGRQLSITLRVMPRTVFRGSAVIE